MDEETNEVADATDLEELDEVAETDQTDWKAEAEKARGIAQRALTKIKKLSEVKVEKPVEPVKEDAKAGELNAVESLLLEVKGIQDSDEVALYEKWKADTGRDGRQILNNGIFQKELEALRADKAVKDAIPSATKRGGSQTNDVAAALAKFDQSGVLPDDYALKSAVVNAITARASTNKPTWH